MCVHENVNLEDLKEVAVTLSDWRLKINAKMMAVFL